MVVELHIYISSVEYYDIDFISENFRRLLLLVESEAFFIWDTRHIYVILTCLSLFFFVFFLNKDGVKFYRLRAINFLEFIFALPIRSTARHIFLHLLSRKLIFSLGHSKEFEKFLTYKYLYSNRNTKMFFFEFFFLKKAGDFLHSSNWCRVIKFLA